MRAPLQNSLIGISLSAGVDKVTPPSQKRQAVSFVDRMGSDEQATLEKAFALMLVATNVLFHWAEQPIVKWFFGLLRPSFVVPSRFKLSQPLLFSIYSSVHEEMTARLKETKYLTITLDGWARTQGATHILNFMACFFAAAFFVDMKARHTGNAFAARAAKEAKMTTTRVAKEAKAAANDKAGEKTAAEASAAVGAPAVAPQPALNGTSMLAEARSAPLAPGLSDRFGGGLSQMGLAACQSPWFSSQQLFAQLTQLIAQHQAYWAQQQAEPWPATDRTPSFLLVEKLSSADSVDEVLQLAERLRQGPAASSFHQVELLAALARCLAGGGSGGGGSGPKAGSQADAAARVKALLPVLLKDLAAREQLLSFKQLVSVLCSIRALLRMLRLAPPHEAVRLAAALPGAAARSAAPPLPSPSLVELESAFTAARQICVWAEAGGGGGAEMAAVASQRLRAYVSRVLVEDAARVEGLRATSSMGELTAAVKLAAAFALPQPRAWVEAVAARVDEFVAAALPPETRRVEVEVPEAEQGGAETTAAQERQRPGPAQVPGSQSAADKSSAGGAPGAVSAASSNGGSAKGESTSPASDSSNSSGSPGVRKSRQPRGKSRGSDSRPEASLPAHLDVGSLAALLTAWGVQPPQPHLELDFDFDWPAWMFATAESVWLSQDIATQQRRQELLNRIAALEAQRAQKQQQLDKAVSTARRQGTNDSGGGGGGDGDGAGTAGGQPRKGPARGEPRGGRGPAGGRRGKQQHLTSGRGPRGGAPDAGGGGPAAAVVDTAALAAAIAGDEASLDLAAQELSTLGPVVARESGSGGGSARGAVPQPLGVVQLVELAWTVGRVAGPRCGARGSQLAEQVLRQRLGEMAGQPALVVQSLVAVGLMRPQLDDVTVSLALGQLGPKLSELPPRESLELITLLSTRVAAPPRTPAPREVLEPLAAGVAAAAARDAAPTELVPSLLRLCAGWGVPLPADSLGAVARAVERRVRREMMEGGSTDLALWQSLKESKRYMVESLSGGVVSGDPSSGGGSSAGGGGSFLGGLMEGVVLPLAALGQHFEGYETTMAALHRWLEAGLPGLTAAKASALLGQVAAASGWPHVPLFRKDLELLMVAVLREEWLLGQEVGAAELSQLLLAACRALRVMAAKVVRSGSVPEDAAPRVAPLLLPAVEWLLALQPGADAVAAAMQGLFVELQLPADGGALAGMTAAASGGGGGGASPSPPLPPLAARLLSQAEPSLDSDGFSSARSGAFILAACARCGYVPPLHLLTKVYDATRRALRRPTGASPGAVPAASAEVLVSLVESVSRLDAVQAATAGNDAAAEADGGAASAAATAAAAARDALLQEVVLGLTTEEALRVLRSQPDRLATALRLVALAGVKNLPDSWIASCAAAVQDLLPALSHRGLAHAASGLALLGARPPAAFVESMLLRAEKAVGGASNWKRYDVDELGLLLGAAHVLWGGSGREASGGGQQLSRAAQDAWDRAHINFVSAQADALPRYRPNELQMTVAAVAAYELSRPWAGGGGGGGGSGGKGPAGRSGPGKAASLRPTDYMGGVEAKWVESCGAALLEARRRRKLAVSSGGRLAVSELPPAGLLVDVLRLASRVVADSADGSIRQLAAAAGTVEDLAEYVRLSLADWAAAASDDDNAGGRGGPGKPGSAFSLSLSVADWGLLLAAALDAGIQPPAPTLAAYCSHLFPLLAEEAGRQQQEEQQEQQQRQSRTDVGERQRALWAAAESALRRVLLRVLPWVPPTPLASLFAGEGFLARAPLQAASMGQLGLVCTYCTQAGMVVGKEAVWERLRLELRRRANAAMTREGAAAAQVNAGAVRRQAGGGPTRQEAAAAAQSDPWVAAGTGPASAADVAAVCYAVKTSGKDPDAAVAMQWLRSLLAEEAAAAAATAGPKSTQRTPKDARTGVSATGGASPGHWYPADSRPLVALAALQRLWVLYGDRYGGSTAGTIDEMEALCQGLKTAFQSEDALDVLLPYQIAQLVELYDTAALGAPNELVTAAPVDAAAGLLPQGVAAAVLQRLAAAVGSDSFAAFPASPALAATALAKLLPIATGSGSGSSLDGASGRQQLPRWAVALAAVAETALPSLPLRRAAALLMALEGRSGWRLQMPLLQMLVGRLLEQGPEADWQKGDGGDRRVREAVVARRPPPGVATVDADALSGRELLQVVTALIHLASQSQQSQSQLQNQNRQHHQPQPTHHPPSPSSSEEVLAAVQPLLERLFPAAEQQLQAAALHEQLARRVRASGVAAAQYVDLQRSAVRLKKSADTWGVAIAWESAREASRVMASAVIALLLQHMGNPEVEQQQRLEEGRPADQQLQNEPAEAAGAPAQEAGALVSGLVSARGDRALPRPVAAVVLLLLGCEGVVQAVPEAQLRRALITSLVGHEGLPMREDTAAALAARVRMATGALTPLDRARQLRLCGASAVFSHREILHEDYSWKRLRGLELEDREKFLREMYESGLQELTAATVMYKNDLTSLHNGMIVAMLTWSSPGGPLLSPENLPTALECFRHLRLLAGRLDRMPGLYFAAADVARSGGNYTRALVPTRWPEAGGKSGSDPKAWPRLLWALLDELCEMGPADLMRYHAQLSTWVVLSNLGVRTPTWRPHESSKLVALEIGREIENSFFWRYVSQDGPYILDAGEAASFARALWPSVEAHARAVTERSGSWTSHRAAPPPLAAPPASAMAEAESGALLSCRQLGLLYGLVALRSALASAGHEEEMERYRDQIWPLYLAALDELVARTDLAPLDHLNAVLDAVQPLVCPDVDDMIWPPYYKHQSDGGGGVMSQLADRLAAVVEPLVSGRVPLPQLWPGEQDEPEYDALWKAFRPACLGPLEDDLYWPAGSPLRLQLPAALSPPPGRRHGFGDPVGDAAREEFVARLEPWHVAVDRLVMMTAELQKADIVPVTVRLVARGVDEETVAGCVLSRYLWTMLKLLEYAAAQNMS
ncbi:hypothetical protein PLESTM_000153100 [Pleodorina starrii]|nr:hypothetical protein PLESTM_000153100 [Pleodorina starrii]